MRRRIIVIVTARDEADRLGATLEAIGGAFPGARAVVADDGSRDPTAHVALQGGAATLAAERVMAQALEPDAPIVILCDGDLGDSAAGLAALAAVVERGEADVAVAAFAHREGGGFGFALRFARWAIRRLAGIELRAPISGQRALRGDVLPVVVPFARGFGMEIAMTVDAVRAGYRLVEVELGLGHRATGRTLRGFVHRGRQLADFARVYLDRR